METKQNTWEDCLETIAQKNGHKDFSLAKYRLRTEDLLWLIREAAELYNQETAKERDSYKSGAEQWKATSKYQEDEINKLREENERLKELSDRWGTELLKLKDDYNSLKQLNSELLSALKDARSTFEHKAGFYKPLITKIDLAISKASDGYTKAKD